LKKNYNEVYKMNVLTYINKYGCWNDLNYIIKTNYKNNYEYKLFANQLKEDKKKTRVYKKNRRNSSLPLLRYLLANSLATKLPA